MEKLPRAKLITLSGASSSHGFVFYEPDSLNRSWRHNDENILSGAFDIACILKDGRVVIKARPTGLSQAQEHPAHGSLYRVVAAEALIYRPHETGWPSRVSRGCGQPVPLGLVEGIARPSINRVPDHALAPSVPRGAGNEQLCDGGSEASWSPRPHRRSSSGIRSKEQTSRCPPANDWSQP
jgi:hypothetical protein